MILKKVKIYNYRQLQKVELDLQNSLTVLAGPNNSGKTTLISVLKGMFRDKKLSFTYSDIPTNLSTSWVEKIIPVFQSIMVENDKNTGISEIIKKISVDDKLLPEYTIECFHAEIQVDYDPTGDDIQLFADYLMDLDESKHSFYFIYSYEPSIASFEKYLGECYDKMSSRFLDISNPDCKEKETKLYFIKEELLKLYCHASLEKCYFCNSNYIYEESAEYQQVLNIEIAEIKNLANYLRTPYISTQHGVKGESHQSVVFVAADNYSTPNVRMYSFFELWSKNTFSLPEFEDLFYSYSKIIMEVEAKLRMKISDLTAETHNKNEANKKLLAEYSNQVLNTYRDNKLFEALLKDDFIAYLAKSTVGNAKNIFKISKIEGILTAYKLFYVGCSRARKNLVIVVDETKINKFENEFKAKLISIGFEIQGFPMQETATV